MGAVAVSVADETILGRFRRDLTPALLPAGLLLVAVAAVAALAYGTRPGLARFEGGIETIVLVRRVQWLLVGVTLIACLSLVTCVIAGKTSAWCLVGLAPVLALFSIRFAPRYAVPLSVLDTPLFVSADHPGAPHPDEWVVGLTFEGETYAFPYRALYITPVVELTDYNRRMLLMWSAHANRAVAVNITRDLRPRALEIVSTPADAMLIFDRRYGQFISSVTGRTLDGEEPIGFAKPIGVTKTTWGRWKAAHTTTRVMLPAGNVQSAPAQPVPPRARLPRRVLSGLPAGTPVAILGTQPPVAIRTDVPIRVPLNLVAGETRVLIVQHVETGDIRAFERRVSEDLFPQFSTRKPRRDRPQASLVDSDTGSLWTIDGRALDGPLKGEQMREIPVEEGLWWGVMKFWYPQLGLLRGNPD